MNDGVTIKPQQGRVKRIFSSELVELNEGVNEELNEEVAKVRNSDELELEIPIDDLQGVLMERQNPTRPQPAAKSTWPDRYPPRPRSLPAGPTWQNRQIGTGHLLTFPQCH